MMPSLAIKTLIAIQVGIGKSHTFEEFLETKLVPTACPVRIGNQNLLVDLVPLGFIDFDIVKGMDTLGAYHATSHCHKTLFYLRVLVFP